MSLHKTTLHKVLEHCSLALFNSFHKKFESPLILKSSVYFCQQHLLTQLFCNYIICQIVFANVLSFLRSSIFDFTHIKLLSSSGLETVQNFFKCQFVMWDLLVHLKLILKVRQFSIISLCGRPRHSYDTSSVFLKSFSECCLLLQPNTYFA